MKLISLLGSTGSIGQQTLDVVAHHPNLFKTGFGCLDEADCFCEQVYRFDPAYVVIYDALNIKFSKTVFRWCRYLLVRRVCVI